MNHESLLILTELTSVFTDEKDVQLICDIKEKENIFKDRHEVKQAEMKRSIKDLREVEMKAQRKQSKEQYSAKLTALEKEKEHVSGNLSQMERNMKKLEEDLSRLSVFEESLQAKANALGRETGEELPRTKHLLGLYRNISNVQWNEAEAFIEGHVTLLDDVRPFSFDPTKHSKSAVANKLWDLMG